MKKPTVKFDSEGYQVGLETLNGEPLPPVGGTFQRPSKPMPRPPHEYRVAQGAVTVTRKWGGSRSGAGRKPMADEKRVARSVALPGSLWQALQRKARQQGISVNTLLARKLAKAE